MGIIYLQYIRRGVEHLGLVTCDRLSNDSFWPKFPAGDCTLRVHVEDVASPSRQPSTPSTPAAPRARRSWTCWAAEFETNLRRQRQLEGIAAAKARGANNGRKPWGDSAEVQRLRVGEKLGATAIARRLGVGRAYLYTARWPAVSSRRKAIRFAAAVAAAAGPLTAQESGACQPDRCGGRLVRRLRDDRLPSAASISEAACSAPRRPRQAADVAASRVGALL